MWHLPALYIVNMFNPFNNSTFFFNNSTFHNSINRSTEVDMITFFFFFPKMRKLRHREVE